MLKLTAELSNPWCKQDGAHFRGLGAREYSITKNKAVCIEHFLDTSKILAVTINTQFRGTDHAGPELEICLFLYHARIKFYDVRHWNYSENRWMMKEEHLKEASEIESLS